MTNDPPDMPFKYGWCKTDTKSGLAIRKDYRKTDYMKDEPYASRVREMLEQLGLPYPEDEEIFRGTHHDLLFLDSHGVVIRIGPTDVTDLMNPGILQPLGWLEDKSHRISGVPLTVAVYPGIELKKDFYIGTGERPSSRDLIGFLKASGQATGDVGGGNDGIIRILDDDNNAVAIEVVLDADNQYNSSSRELSERRLLKIREHQENYKNKSDVLFHTLQDVFNNAAGLKSKMLAFQTHQPLRQLFWDAFEDANSITDMPDPVRRQAFWDKCAEVTNHPQAVVMPVWSAEKDAEGHVTCVRKEILIPNLVLYRPWTGKKVDKVVAPVLQAAVLQESIHRAHAERIKRPAPPPAPKAVRPERAK